MEPLFVPQNHHHRDQPNHGMVYASWLEEYPIVARSGLQEFLASLFFLLQLVGDSY